jgi:aspartyl-tRNA(Asn)/glutamyl-tRNA(Gln) amidotransferase subunit C
MGNSNQPSTLDAKTVQYVAYLVRLGITAQEAEAFSPQLAAIIDYFRLLNEVDTADIPPACETSPVHNSLRCDEVRPSMPRQDFLQNVPQTDGGCVRVPQVFGEE